MENNLYFILFVIPMERVDLMLNRKCNTHCIFCYMHGLKDFNDDFNIINIKKTLDKGAEIGYKELYISGGEPTLNNNLPDIISYAKKKGFNSIKIMTNGLRISYSSFLKKLVLSGLTEIAFSLHGADSITHDIHTGYKGSFRLITKAIENALKIKKLKIEINSVITKKNIGKMKELCKFTIKKGINHIHFQLIVPNSKAAKKLFPSVENIKGKFTEIFDKYSPLIEDIDCAFVPFCYMKGYEKFIVKFDITQKFFSNSQKMFLSWKKSLLNNKIKNEECNTCHSFNYCRGHWKVD